MCCPVEFNLHTSFRAPMNAAVAAVPLLTRGGKDQNLLMILMIYECQYMKKIQVGIVS